MISAYLQLIRLPGLFSAFSNILAAYFVGSQGDVIWSELLILLIASGCFYSAGMVLNDCYDIAEDRRERPARPLASGRITLRRGWWSGWTLLVVGIGVSSLLGGVTFGVALVLVILIVLYNAKAKHGNIGPYVMGACRYVNWLLGLSPFLTSPLLFLLPFPLFSYIVALTWLSKIETQDEESANAMRIRRYIRYCAFGIVVSLLAVVMLMIVDILSQHWVLIPVAGGALWLLYQLYCLSKHHSADATQSIVERLLLGIIPLDALLVFSSGLWWGGVIIVMLLVPSRLLARKIYMT